MTRGSAYLCLARALMLRARAVEETRRHTPMIEVLPYYYGAPQKDPAERAIKSIHDQSDSCGEEDSPASESERLRYIGMDSQQLGSDSGAHSTRRAATIGVAPRSTLPPARVGDRAGQSLGEQEAVTARSRWSRALVIEIKKWPIGGFSLPQAEFSLLSLLEGFKCPSK